MKVSDSQPGSLPQAVAEAMSNLGGTRKSIEVVHWIESKYPSKFDAKSIQSQLRRSSVNNPGAIRRHPGAPGFLFKVSTGVFEEYSESRHGLFDSKGFKEGTRGTLIDAADELEELADDLQEQIAASNEFAYEAHLRDYLARNPTLLESGLSLWTGNVSGSVEYPVDGRRIDILAKDKQGVPVIIELKLSKGHERTLGQALFYRAKLKQILQLSRIRIIMVAAEITDELQTASTEVSDVKLFSYILTMQLKPVALD